MIKIPKEILTLAEAAKKYGLNPGTLKDYVNRGRLEAVKKGKTWFTSSYAMEKYLKSRDKDKIPKRYRKSN